MPVLEPGAPVLQAIVVGLAQIRLRRDGHERVGPLGFDRRSEPAHQRRHPRNAERTPVVGQRVGIGEEVDLLSRVELLPARWDRGEAGPQLRNSASASAAVVELGVRISSVVEMDAIDRVALASGRARRSEGSRRRPGRSARRRALRARQSARVSSARACRRRQGCRPATLATSWAMSRGTISHSGWR